MRFFFVEQPHLQRSLSRELGCLGFDVILPVTWNEARQALQASLQAPDVVVMDLRNADGTTSSLLNIMSQAEVNTPVVLVAGAADVSTQCHLISMTAAIVLSSELDKFSASVCRLCRLKVRGWSGADLEKGRPLMNHADPLRTDILDDDGAPHGGLGTIGTVSAMR